MENFYNFSLFIATMYIIFDAFEFTFTAYIIKGKD